MAGNLKDIKPLVYPAQSLGPVAVTAAANGTGVDLSNYDACLARLSVGALGGTTPTVTFKLQESDDDVTYTDVADADLDGGANGITISAANANASSIITRTYMGYKKYVRWICSAVSGTTPSLPTDAGFILGHPHAYIGY